MIEFPDPMPYDPRLEEFKVRVAMAVVAGALLFFAIAVVVTW
jgi:hypothetical protein